MLHCGGGLLTAVVSLCGARALERGLSCCEAQA